MTVPPPPPSAHELDREQPPQLGGQHFPGAAIEQARDLAVQAGADIEFVHADVYDAVDVLGAGSFDLVYTGIGALCWLPDVTAWADVVARLLAPRGRLFLREGHPVLWALADARPDGLLVVDHPYFETDAPSVWDEPGTYVATHHDVQHTRSATWNHGIGEVVTALMAQGLSPGPSAPNVPL